MDQQTIGANIRQLRTQARQSLTDLARVAGMTKGSLSKIETGSISAPISTLMRLADAMGVRLAEFFAEPDNQAAYVLTRRGKGRLISRDGSRFGYSYEALAVGMPAKLAEPFVLTIRPGDPAGRFQHGGQEFIYMLSGALEVSVAGERITLQVGDSLYFNPTASHATQVVGTVPARFLCVFIQDEGAARPATPSKATARARVIAEPGFKTVSKPPKRSNA